jgi:Rrf2 family protein
MKLSSRGDYATRALLELSGREGQAALSVAELSRRTGISPKYLEQIMLALRAARVVRSRRGAHGGYELAREAGDLTVGEVVRLMDGPLAPSPCASQSAHIPCPAYRCPTEDACVLRGLWLDVRNAIAGVLDSTTFAELAERQQTARVAGRGLYRI